MVAAFLSSVYFRFLAVGYLDIYIRSEGCNDPNKTPNTCGIAYIKVNGHDRSMHRRGHNVVVVDATTGNAAVRRVDRSICFLVIVLAQFKGALPPLSRDV